MIKVKKKHLVLVTIGLLISILIGCSSYIFKRSKEIRTYSKKVDTTFFNAKLDIHNRNFNEAQNKIYSIIGNKDSFKMLPDKYKFDAYNYLAILNLKQEKFLNALTNYKEAFKYADKDLKLVIKLNMSLAYRYMGSYVTSTNLIHDILNSNIETNDKNSYLKEYALLNLAEIYWIVKDMTDFKITLNEAQKYLNNLPESDSQDLSIMYLSYRILEAIYDNNLNIIPEYISEIKELEIQNTDTRYSELEMLKERSYALYYKAIGQYPTSIEYFENLEKLANNEGATYVVLFSLSERIDIYKDLGNTEKANLLINEYYEKQTKILDTNDYQFKYYINNNIIKSSEIPFMKEAITILLLISLALIILIIFYFKKAKKSKLDSIKDGLCNIYNRRFLDQYINNIKSKELPISFLMVDVDYFKLYNDNYGHQEGDLVLKHIANILKQNCRKEDIVARYGGEEFCVLLKGANKHTAMNFAKRAKENLDTIDIKHNYSKVSDHVTFSIGIFTLQSIKHLKYAIKFSDRALYISKRNGRNRATHLEDCVDTDFLE
ncbi:diguanylate cyclase [Clostridium sp. B9]|uniref:diguanylate cyclase n=1 Tax=Clostridium sp. B9 TaxID=3423224 RepID=UPI003D2EC6FE